MMNLKTLVLAITVSIFSFGITSCGSSSSSDVHELQEKQKKKKNPLDFISASGSIKKTLVGKWIIEGTITNLGLTDYKDLAIQIKYFSKTESLIKVETQTVFEFFPSNKSTPFTLKVEKVKGAKSITWDVIDAVAK